MSATVEKSDRHYQYIPGFGELADFLSSDHDHTTAVYKRFDKLSSRNLLYYQSELLRLQRRQDDMDIQDRRDVESQTGYWREVRKVARDWEVLRGGLDDGETQQPSTETEPSRHLVQDERARERVAIAMEIRSTLKEYREALLQESALLALQPPTTQTMKAIANYFHRETQDGSQRTYPLLTGASSTLYPRDMDAHQIGGSDYIALRPSDDTEILTYILKTYCPRLFQVPSPQQVLPQHQQDTISHLPQSQINQYSMRRVRFVASFITTLTAAMLLIAPIYALYHTAPMSPALTLGLIVLFTVMFAGAVFVMSQARRAEIFGACAAYAAVLVVFVSGDFISGHNG